jgi:hypothetical protein
MPTMPITSGLDLRLPLNLNPKEHNEPCPANTRWQGDALLRDRPDDMTDRTDTAHKTTAQHPTRRKLVGFSAMFLNVHNRPTPYTFFNIKELRKPMKKINRLALVLLLLLPALASAKKPETYTLPDDWGKKDTPFEKCDYSSSALTVTCDGKVKLDKEVLIITSNLTLIIDGDFELKQNVEINTENSYSLAILVTGSVTADDKKGGIQAYANLDAKGNVEFGKKLTWVGSIVSDGSIKIGKKADIRGNLFAKETLDFGDKSKVVGSCSATGGNYADFCTPATVLPSPVLEYRFDESSWNGSTGQVVDSSTHSSDATSDTASFTTTSDDAVMCQAADFTGGNKFITSTDLSTLRTTASLSFWIKTTQSGDSKAWSSPGVTGIEQARGSNDIFWGWLDKAGHIGLTVGNDDSAHSNISINNDTYHHIVLTRDALADTYQIFIDGDLDVARAYRGDAVRDTITNVFNDVGRVGDTGGSLEYLDALVDEFIVFDSVLTADHVDTIFTLQSDGKNLDGTVRDCASVEPQIDHYELERDFIQGLTCEPLNIEIRACLNNDCSEQADGSVTTEFSPSSGSVGSDTLTYTSGDILAFQRTTPGDLNFGVDGSTPDFTPGVADPVRCFFGDNQQTNCEVTFADTDLRFFDSESVTNSPTLDLIAGKVSSFDMRLVVSDETTGRCETQLLDSDHFTTTIGTQCETPNACLADQQVIWDQSSVDSISLPNPQDWVGGSATISALIAFDSQGNAPFELSAPDVGVQSLKVNISLLDADDGSTKKLIEGSVNLRVRPESLVLSAVEVGDTHIAGQLFDVAIQALGVNTDGTTYVVPSFGRIGGSYTVNWSLSSLALPTATAASTVIPVIGTLAGATTPDGYTDTDPVSRKESITFSAANGLAYLEVGAVKLVAQIENYLGSNENVQSSDPLVGRFIPGFLTATQVGVAAWGSDVSFYQGQAKSLEGLEYEVLAYAKDGIVPLNYYEGAGLLDAFNDSKVVHVITGTSVDLVGDLVWTMSGHEDFDDTIHLTASTTPLSWPRPGIPTEADISRTIDSLQLSADAATLADDDDVCIVATDSVGTPGNCMASITAVLQVDRFLQYARAALPAQVDADTDTDTDTDTMTAYVEISLETLDSFDLDGNPVFVPQSSHSALDGTIFEGLYFDDTLHACTLEGTGTCSDIANSSIFTGPDGTGNALVMGLGLVGASSSTSGLMGARLNAPDWLSWNWDGDVDGTLELDSTLLIFGEYQGRSPLLFSRPQSR